MYEIKLEEISEKALSKESILGAIVRAHRGGKDRRAIFVKFNNNLITDKIKLINFKRKNIYINQMRSLFVTARIKNALIFRKNLKSGDGMNWRIFVNDRVQLMIRRPDEFKYTVFNSF